MFVDLGLCWSLRVGFDSLYCMLALMLNGFRPALLDADGAYESLLLCRCCQLNLIYHIDAGVLGPQCPLDVLCCTVVADCTLGFSACIEWHWILLAQHVYAVAVAGSCSWT
ncbi:hypothetical protein Nepgr_013536 [Nepenthes gracilis]|uniref:Uncharacterized protein n=1 Tax=Nepenthes gracilis TaxID=150966 RepID=A0AAD3SJ13_NEPGR|nr:hypothetical protein Nepgr_013536 [Nepenthes gracilis]